MEGKKRDTPYKGATVPQYSNRRRYTCQSVNVSLKYCQCNTFASSTWPPVSWLSPPAMCARPAVPSNFIQYWTNSLFFCREWSSGRRIVQQKIGKTSNQHGFNTFENENSYPVPKTSNTISFRNSPRQESWKCTSNRCCWKNIACLNYISSRQYPSCQIICRSGIQTCLSDSQK